MRYLLDTSTFLKAAAQTLTSRRAKKIMLDPNHTLELSVVSLIEIHIKRGLNKLEITAPQLDSAITDMDLKILPLTASHCETFAELPVRHKDPFDRMIIAQALAEKVPVLSGDAQFALYKGLKVIW